jgi:imidazolonepropionase-like amidohydrolase
MGPSPRRKETVLAALLASLVLVQDQPAPAPAPVPERGTFAFVGATVVPMDQDGVLADHVVIVRAGRIEALGPRESLEIPHDALRVDARGRWLIPGLADMHGHLPGQASPPDEAPMSLLLFLANGVTTVRGMLGDQTQITLRERVARGDLVGPRLLVGSPALGGHSVFNPEQARKLVAIFAEHGYDHVKVHEGLSRDVFDAIADGAHEHGLPFGGHVSYEVGLEHSLARGQWTVDHLDNVIEELVDPETRVLYPTGLTARRLAENADEERMPHVVRELDASGAGVVPTLALWELMLSGRAAEELQAERPETRYMHPGLVARWAESVDDMAAGGADPAHTGRVVELLRAALKALHEAGVPILFGTDSPQLYTVPGFSMRHEACAMVACGLSPRDVLETATIAVARFLGDTQNSGAIAPGKRADLVLLNANPLASVDALFDVAGVMVDGRWLPRDALDARLEQVAAARRASK